MPTLTLKNIPTHVHARLKESAEKRTIELIKSRWPERQQRGPGQKVQRIPGARVPAIARLHEPTWRPE
jgi:hypothetical protein